MNLQKITELLLPTPFSNYHGIYQTYQEFSTTVHAFENLTFSVEWEVRRISAQDTHCLVELSVGTLL